MKSQYLETRANKVLEKRPSLLSDKALDRCASVAPSKALEFAGKRLTKERLDDCASRAPGAALQFANELLTEARRIKCEEICGAHTPIQYVDALGQPVSFPNGGMYSIAAGDRWFGSKRDFSNYLRENGLCQRIDLAMGRKNHNGLRNAPRKR